ncbi:undecaprenyl/decaprenyl-phosphate alpha-N-acetylglucosaminyl 1-phosphate transferase [bacterium]|nr:undecaprenyl/decaprenyl-phosphate alpha-N-acetylglucosaminyl 1-phosphate transferase [bacterium]
MLGLVFLIPLAFISYTSGDIKFGFIGAFVLLIGILDDIFDLSAIFKLILQISAAGLYFLLFPSTTIFQLFLLVFIFNAFNLSDGIDGLLLSLTFISISCVFFFYRDPSLLFLFSTMLLLTLVNCPKAKIYLGDTGSHFLGLIFFHFFRAAFTGVSGFYLLPIFIMICFYPFFDTSFALIRRSIQKKNPMRGDLKHIHHVLREKFGAIRSLILLISLNLINNVIFITIYKYVGLKIIPVSSIIILAIEGFLLIYAWKSKRL